LRERKEDIDLLSDHFLRKYAVRYGREYEPLSECMRREFYQYRWPGNVRELESMIQCISALGNEDIFYEKVRNHGPSIVPGNGKGPVAAQEAVGGGAAELLSGRTFKELCKRAVRKAESDAIVDVLTYTDWNRKKAAALLRTSYRTLLDRIKEYEIERSARNYPQGIAAPGSASSLFS
jgi:DNA-binding NtrC family response regulator